MGIKKISRLESIFGLFLSLAQWILFIWLWPKLMQAVWPTYLYYKEEYHFKDQTYFLLIGSLELLLILLVGNCFYFFLYKNKFAFFEQYKATEEPWPWESDPAEWNRMFWRSLKFNFFNLFISLPIMNAPFIIMDYQIPNPEDYNIPTGLTFLLQILFCCLMEDVLFYFGHAFLHTPYMYKTFHKYHHEQKQTTSLACIHGHPIEFIIANVVPELAGAILLGKRMHISTQYGFAVIRMINSFDEHCGYNFSWSMERMLPLHLHQDEHFYHHSENLGSYGSFFEIWDYVLGSNTQFFKSLDSAKDRATTKKEN